MGGQSQDELVRMGRVAEPEILPRQNPQMRKIPELRFDKDSEGYLLCPSLHAASCLTPVWEELPRYSDKVKDLPKERSTTSEFYNLWEVYTSYPISLA